MLIMFLEIIVVGLGIIYAGGIIYLISKGHIFNGFYHNIMEWHLPDNKPQEFDGCNFHSHCKICGKEIMQDSQGNWY